MTDLDARIRERLAAAADVDVVIHPRDVHEKLAHRQRRIRHRRRTAALLGVVTAAGIAVGVAFAVERNSGGDVVVRPADAPPPTSDDGTVSNETLPHFRPAPGWDAVRVGSGVPPEAPVATAANVPLGPDALEGNLPAGETIGRLEEGDVLLQAVFYPTGNAAVDAAFPPRELPLSLDDAQPGGIEGAPDDIFAERLLAQVNGWNIDLLIFFGGTDPTGMHADVSPEARAAAQEQLARLAVPPPSNRLREARAEHEPLSRRFQPGTLRASYGGARGRWSPSPRRIRSRGARRRGSARP